MTEDEWVGTIDVVSEVVMNRPSPLRAFDQIYMRAGDMVRQAMHVASWAADRNVAFIGDGDGLALTVALLAKNGLIRHRPERMEVFDFDERIVNSIKRLVARERLRGVEARLYNCLDAFPAKGGFDRFYTNPPWGESNGGSSVSVFARRGIEAIGYSGEGLIVAADDPELEWPGRVLQKVQAYAIGRGFHVVAMEPRLHRHLLPEAEHLRSCNLVIGSGRGSMREHPDDSIEEALLKDFYGRSKEPRVRYIRDRARFGGDRALDQDYRMETWEHSQ